MLLLYLCHLNEKAVECQCHCVHFQTSKCCEEIKDYIVAGEEEDILVKGMPEDKNPFKEKGGCVVC